MSMTVDINIGELPFISLPGRADGGMVLVCDHASNKLPNEYDFLGLSSEDFERHIAYDIGAAQVTRLISELLDIPAIMSCFSRLLVDPNRSVDDPTIIMQISDGAVIPGNAHIGEVERKRRIGQFYEPYHKAIDDMIALSIKSCRPPAIISIHSFTQAWRGKLRPWEAAILWDDDLRLVKPMLDCLRKETDFNIGDNQPYSGKLEGDCMYRHATCKGLAHVLVEIRQDQIKDAEGQKAWAGRLADILSRIFEDEKMADELATIKK